MKTIGMIGGMSWESSVEYYKLVNEGIHQALGGVHSAKSVMVSVDFAEVEVLQKEGRWSEATQMMVNAARQVEAAGADFLIICTNTMHLMADEVQAAIQIPLLHIADAAANAVLDQGIHTVGLLGTRFTMQGDFYKGRLADKFGLKVYTPITADQDIVHDIIYDELVVGKILPASKAAYQKIILNLAEQGAQGIILGCTEIGLLVQQSDCSLPLFDTTLLHAQAAVQYALKD
ncbi:MAG: aspartate racemase [Anaerolinea sp.]|nr:aspartate racemase [Anaerolinea sp.]